MRPNLPSRIGSKSISAAHGEGLGCALFFVSPRDNEPARMGRMLGIRRTIAILKKDTSSAGQVTSKFRESAAGR